MTDNKQTPPIQNIDTLSMNHWKHGEKFEAHMAQIGPLLGARKLGYRVVVLPPGKTAWPLHAHYVNEEMFFILAGRGTLRLGQERHVIQGGDIIAIPPGPDSAHQIINDSDAELKYLCISTMEHPDIVAMPDSQKFNIMVGSPPGGDRTQRTLSGCWPKDAAVDYWQNEG